MSQVTPPSSWALLLYACAERTSPFYPFSFSRLLLAAEMPPDAGHGKRESAPATISGCHVFPVLKPSCHAFAKPGMADKTVWRHVPPAENLQPQAMHAWQWRLQDFCHGGRKAGLSPYPLRRPLNFPVARCAILYASPFSFPPLQQVCRYSHAAIPDGISGHFRCRGKGKDGIRFSKFFSHNLHTSQAQVVFCRKNLQNLLPNLCMAPETKTTDARSEDVTRKHRTYGEAKRKRTRPDLPIRARQVTTT